MRLLCRWHGQQTFLVPELGASRSPACIWVFPSHLQRFGLLSPHVLPRVGPRRRQPVAPASRIRSAKSKVFELQWQPSSGQGLRLYSMPRRLQRPQLPCPGTAFLECTVHTVVSAVPNPPFLRGAAQRSRARRRRVRRSRARPRQAPHQGDPILRAWAIVHRACHCTLCDAPFD